MATQATVTLDTLHCILESDRGGSSHSEPYIWPFLASITNNSFETTPTGAFIANSRAVVRKEMRAGDDAIIDGPFNRLTATFQDGQTNRQLILVVALWEEDDTPVAAVTGGYQAFLDTLHTELFRNLIPLRDATEEQQRAIIAQINANVLEAVTTAIHDHLSTSEKVQVFLGFLNLDDFMASDSKRFPDLTPTAFALSLKGFAGDPLEVVPGDPTTVVNPPVEYAILGNLTIQDVQPPSCQAETDAVNAAQATLQGFDDLVARLQALLETATPQQKPGIIAQIKRINTQLIPPAQAALDAARRALQTCQASHPGTTERSDAAASPG